jgi:hypothetical protein
MGDSKVVMIMGAVSVGLAVMIASHPARRLFGKGKGRSHDLAASRLKKIHLY